MEDNEDNEMSQYTEITAEHGTRHAFARPGSRTGHGGRVTRSTSTGTVAGHRLARVGETVTHEDGSKATFVDVASSLFISHGHVISDLFDPAYIAPDHSAGAV